MPIVITIDAVLACRKLRAKEAAEMIGVGGMHLPLFAQGRYEGAVSTLAKLCAVLECQPGEILGYEADAEDLTLTVDDA